MADLVKTLDVIRHNQFRPLYQSLKAHIELAYNDSLHINVAVLKDVAKRLQNIESDLLNLIKEE